MCFLRTIILMRSSLVWYQWIRTMLFFFQSWLKTWNTNNRKWKPISFKIDKAINLEFLLEDYINWDTILYAILLFFFFIKGLAEMNPKCILEPLSNFKRTTPGDIQTRTLLFLIYYMYHRICLYLLPEKCYYMIGFNT